MYNAEKYIEETLACIKAQTMQDFHLLLVDDCSTDRTVEYVERFFHQNQPPSIVQPRTTHCDLLISLEHADDGKRNRLCGHGSSEPLLHNT